MYHRKRDNTQVWSNCTLNLTTQESWSYGWWQVTKRVGTYLLFNTYKYSVSTSGHQSKIYQSLMRQGFNLYPVEAPDGLQAGLEPIIQEHTRLIEELQTKIARKGSWKSTNDRRREAIAHHEEVINTLKDLSKGR